MATHLLDVLEVENIVEGVGADATVHVNRPPVLVILARGRFFKKILNLKIVGGP